MKLNRYKFVSGKPAKRVPAGKSGPRLIPSGRSGVVIIPRSVKPLPWYARLANRMSDIGRWMVGESRP